MVRNLGFIALVLIGLNTNAQEDYIRPGLLKATGTIAPSTMLNRAVNNIYLTGFLEYYTDKHLSLRGETYFFVDGKSKSGQPNLFVHQAMRTYFGAYYHVNKNNWDNYIGFQPGLTLMRALPSVDATEKLRACPSFAIHVGSTFYIWKYFNFYVDLAYVNSMYQGLPAGGQRTDELILSAGLGFQVNTKKAK